MKRATIDVLADAVADRIVDRLASLLEDRVADPAQFLSAAEVAERFNLSRDYVYRHATELGAVPLGKGDRPRLRFDVDVVMDRLAARPSPAATPGPRVCRRRQGSTAELLPIRGAQ